MSTAVVTGASAGIGYEFAKILAQKGHQLALIARNLDRLNEIKQELESKYGVNVILIPADLAVENIAEDIVKEIKYRQLNVEILVNNAGFGFCGYYHEQPWANERDMIQVNITSLSQLTKLMLPSMLEKKRGRICNVASTAAFQAGPMMTVYYATKAYVLHYSEALALELKGTGVTVTCLCPGPTATNFQSTAKLDSTKVSKMSAMETAAQVAATGYEATMAGKSLAISGTTNKLLQFSTRLLPRKTAGNIIYNLQKKRQ